MAKILVLLERIETRSRRACGSGPRLGNWWALTAALASPLFQLLYCSRRRSHHFHCFPVELSNLNQKDRFQITQPNRTFELYFKLRPAWLKFKITKKNTETQGRKSFDCHMKNNIPNKILIFF